jgi:hypothetical protein
MRPKSAEGFAAAPDQRAPRGRRQAWAAILALATAVMHLVHAAWMLSPSRGLQELSLSALCASLRNVMVESRANWRCQYRRGTPGQGAAAGHTP